MPLPLSEQRWQRKMPCSECWQGQAHCDNRQACTPARKVLRPYDGIRLTSDGFDCALPVSVDSHSVCSFGCLYCFSANTVQHRQQADREIGQTSLKALEGIFSGQGGKVGDIYRSALKYDKRNAGGYPCPIQLGAICDPMDNIERNQGWFLKFVELVIKYRQPVRISTKGNLFLNSEYLDAVAQAPELFWVNFSIISPDDNLLPLIDKRAPPPSERIKCMRNLSEIGVKTGLRFRPLIPGLSDRTPGYPKAYRTLVEQAADAGARAISYEVMFLNGLAPPSLKERYREMEQVTGVPLQTIYRQFGKAQACQRPSHQWTENIMHGIYKVAKERGLTVGVSAPDWKQLGDTGCCCGIPPNDEVFGNWQRESATNRLLEARDNGGLIGPDDITPPWARIAPLAMLSKIGFGPTALYKKRHDTWADKLRSNWNEVGNDRGPLIYFQGALVPDRRADNGDLLYRYAGLSRQHRSKVPYWNVDITDLTEGR